jgi:hypothetical protein
MERLWGDRASGPDRRYQGADTQDGDDAFEVVGQDVEAHLRADPRQRAGQEVRRAHPGIVRPSALAVLRLMMSLNAVGCSTGRSAG